MQFEWFYIHCDSSTNRQMIAYDEYSARCAIDDSLLYKVLLVIKKACRYQTVCVYEDLSVLY